MMQSHPWMVIAIIFATLLQVCLLVQSFPKADKIVSLPGQPSVSFQQFAGYITVDEKQQRALFYYFVEAEKKPVSKPLVLWLNGGPGCSSVGAGAFVEHGPFRTNGETLVKNEYSWNKEANILYLESPAGVGFSYSANKSFYNYVNDEMTARDSLVFLQRWFAKFPEYKNRDFFITGESYAGHYVPQLAQLILQSKVKFNLKGIAIGNPLLEFSTDFNSEADYYWSHGLISDSTYEGFTSVCNISQYKREKRRGYVSVACDKVVTQAERELTEFINLYDVTADVCLSYDQLQSKILKNHPLMTQFQLLSSHHLQSDTYTKQQLTGNIDVCSIQKTTIYLNKKDVQKALHARLVGVSYWGLCNGVVKYEDEDKEIPTIRVVGTLVKSGIRALVYSGDQDVVIPFFGTRTLVDTLAKTLGLKTTVPYRTWFEGKQVGGWTQVYGNILSYAAIRGASHTVPSSQPERALVLFQSFLRGKPLPTRTMN